ncbi:MAG: glycine zipper domain-containing protein [Janthinobacterium lividum]
MKNTSWLFLIPVLLCSVLFSSQAQAQRNWSPQGKGAAIGGAAGILGGALINKRNRVVGGAIGGVAGAGVGYAIGKHTDNKRKKAIALANERAAANERIAAANARAAAAERAAAERRSVAAAPGSLGRVAGATAVAAGATALVASAGPAGVSPASGYLPNPDYGNAQTAYPASPVRRKSW